MSTSLPMSRQLETNGTLSPKARSAPLFSIGSMRSAMEDGIFSQRSDAESKISFAKPQSHRLPPWVMYTITVLTAICVAMTNYVIRFLGSYLLRAKLNTMQDVMDSSEDKFLSAVLGAFTLAGFCMVFAASSSLMVVFIAPQCAGSGLPEIKGFLNGNSTPSIFGAHCFPVTVGGIILSTAAGFPIGREGPMVTIGGSIGFRMTRLFGARFTHHRIRIDKNDDKYLASFNDVDRMLHAKRMGSTMGGAAGIAAAFSAPIGGILYMFEEVTATCWSPEHTFRTFVCTLAVAYISRFLLNLEGDEAHTLLIYDASTPSVILNPGVNAWTWTDVPFFILLAAAVGLFSAVFTRALFFVWVWRNSRQQHSHTKEFKIVECMSYAVLCCTAFALVPLLFECFAGFDDADRDGNSDHGNHLHYVRHTCEDGYHSEVATLLLNNAEEALKHLFSRDGGNQFGMLPLVVSFVVYSALAIGMPGIPIPMGMFVPSMLLGALAGRFLGEALSSLDFLKLSHPGIYALTGSAAMLSGFTHMTIAIVVLLLEAAHDLSLIAPLMLGSSVAYLVSHAVNIHGYDEKLILKKGVPYLDATLPKDLDTEKVTALMLCEKIDKQALLPVEASLDHVKTALDCNEDLMDFPILDDAGRCIGLTTRKRLEAATAAYGGSDEEIGLVRAMSKDLSKLVGGALESIIGKDDGDIDWDQRSLWTMSRGGERVISIDRIMDAAPYTILEDMPAPRVYPLFVMAGVNVACVISRSGAFIGILSRANLIKEQEKAHCGEHSAQKSYTMCDHDTNQSRYDSGAPSQCTNGHSPPSKLADESNPLSQLSTLPDANVCDDAQQDVGEAASDSKNKKIGHSPLCISDIVFFVSGVACREIRWWFS